METASRHYLMCRPTYFELDPSNPWKPPDARLDLEGAIDEWDRLRDHVLALGHTVSELPPRPGLTQMVFTANGAFAIGDRVLIARPHSRERAGEARWHHAWFEEQGYRHIVTARHVNEGQGDFRLVGDRILAGWGFRTDPAAHDEARALFDREVVPLRLTQERFYHLDLVVLPLTAELIAYYPPALDEASRRTLERLYPDAIIVGDADAESLALNAICDERHALIHDTAEDLPDQLERHGITPIAVDLDEQRMAGGGPKCCAIDLHAGE
ncbi:dimethylargininase [Bailinhaonella thermotolerans]|uniref:Amidinotransferase n=1 Tax=Bailinhaonella thermotolerans TaxID=1070861 RepID=A0A3A4A831_9ACTN|nr:dimethylargininase [Bailinhaonella thermotolerans]RJL24775.1 hypothetical protein D5H75_28745 [Bailinhaonella thermotolerans]